MSLLTFLLIFAAGLGLGYRLPAWLARWRQQQYRRRFKPILLQAYRPGPADLSSSTEAGEEQARRQRESS